MCGTRFGRLVSIFCFLCLLCSSFCFSEGTVVLTEEEFNQIQKALTLSETELRIANETALSLSNTQTTLLTQFNKREAYWMERDKEQRDKIAVQGLIIKIGVISIGIGGQQYLSY
jgi:hypothetical protein